MAQPALTDGKPVKRELPIRNINRTTGAMLSGELCKRYGEEGLPEDTILYAVVEGVGDHGCEYMTGGRVVVLGKTGRNFAAGMSVGIAYVWDKDKNFFLYCNMSMVELDKIGLEDELTIHELVSKHYKYTASTRAKMVLDNFKTELKKFIKVMPLEYKRIREGKVLEEKLELVEVSDG